MDLSSLQHYTFLASEVDQGHTIIESGLTRVASLHTLCVLRRSGISIIHRGTAIYIYTFRPERGSNFMDRKND